ncbi:long-chain-alcohol oxidase FAO4A-like isoform X2 [Andrographis paniculata]|uniref:long-chain-alcohol oxidase FAO4A-like isoform X2 n=1 Tax=Andrographis paniculata TaxID=175694 RepID=UPI0021E8AF20|nr:long-chain-alcohol oxidase FAO4A-like isoform X2 [Andrographis paniculata]
MVVIDKVNDRNENPSWKAMGYCGPDPIRSPNKRSTQKQQENDGSNKEDHPFGPLHKGIINFHKTSKQMAFQKLQMSGFHVSIPCSSDIGIGPFKPSFIVNCDAVVVGSGSGGGLMAGLLAKAGHKVVVLEKGDYFARSNLSLIEGEAMDRMYLEHGMLATQNMNAFILAGSTVGGGSTINWSASIRTPRHVTKEWHEKHGLELFGSKEYEEALDIVCDRMGVQTGFEHEGFNNMVLRKGCENLGYPVEDIPRNASPDHYCGWCGLGCKDGAKKGTAETWLVDMAESGNGAVLPRCEAIQVITHDTVHGRKRAVGVVFEFQGPEGKEIGIVHAKVIVAACGAICTPELLKRSGLRNPNIGRNLHLHPVVVAWGHFPETAKPWPETAKRSYEGGIMTAMSSVAANWDKSGYGAIIQTPSVHPGLYSILTPWHSAKDFRARMLNFSRIAHVFALARDTSSGTVTSEHDINYTLNDLDIDNLSQGVEKALRILAAAGADEIGTYNKNGKTIKVNESSRSRDEFESFVKEESSRPITGLSTPIGSAHQMGSCRMGVGPDRSAVGPTGETWEVEGLFVTDTSVFPTALGVNPMVTVQAIAYCIGQSVLEVLAKK